MSNAKKIALAILAAAFCASAPAIAADSAASAAVQAAKPDIVGALKDKAAGVVKEKASSAVDGAAENLKESIGLKDKPNQNATQGASEVVDVNQETVTVETPQGTATETTTTITPEVPAAPAK